MTDEKTAARVSREEHEAMGSTNAPSASGPSSSQRPTRDSAMAAALCVTPFSGDSDAADAVMPSGKATLPVGGSHESGSRASRTRRVVAGLVALASVVLIGVSAFSLAEGLAPRDDASRPQSESAASFDTLSHDAADDAQETDASLGDSTASGDTDSAAQQDVQPAQGDAPSAAAAGGTSSQEADVAPSAPPVSSGAASGAGEGAAGDSSARVVNVTVTVDSSVVGNPVSGSGTFSLPQGSTAYDALCQLTTPNGGPGYVRAIGGLAEFDHGSQSGWKYSVNGVDPSVACGSYVLSDGDVVAWRYVTSLNG